MRHRTFKAWSDANERIRRSTKNGLVAGLVTALAIVLIIELIALVTRHSLYQALIDALFTGLLFTPLFALFFGLGAAIQHYILRFWLWRTRTFPWKGQQFPDYAVICILLRRVGGDYSFAHHLLLDYLADLPTGTASTSAMDSLASRNFPHAFHR